MSLRRTSLLSLVITILASALILIAVSQFILTRSFADLENRYLQQNVERVRREVADEIDSLASTAGDYAAWDDTYAFANGELPDYPSVNLTDESVANLGVNLMLLTDQSGKMLTAKGY